MEFRKSQVSTKNKVSIIQNQEVINFLSERITFLKSDGLALVSPIRDPESYNFFGKYNSRKKTSDIRDNEYQINEYQINDYGTTNIR